MSSPPTPHPTPRILFLTSSVPGDSCSPDDEWNHELLPGLAALSSPPVRTTLLSYLDLAATEQLTPSYLAATYTSISLLLLGRYPAHFASLLPILRDTLPAARKLNPDLRIYPGPRTALWNADKSYLRDLRDAGFPVPRTEVLEPRRGVQEVRSALANSDLSRGDESGSGPRGVVVKPSVGASGVWTHKVSDPVNLSREDETFLDDFVSFAQGGATNEDVNCDCRVERGFLGGIMIQEYIDEIRDGEYSICFIDARHLYTVLKRPRDGGWQVNSEHGGTYAVIPETDVPAAAKRIAQEVVKWLQWERFPEEVLAYARIDGVVKADGGFVLMEVELIEPSLFLNVEEQGVGSKGVEALCEVFAV